MTDTFFSPRRQTVLEPITRFCAYFPDINECKSPTYPNANQPLPQQPSPNLPPTSNFLTNHTYPRHKKTQPQTPRLRRHPRQSQKTRRKARQRPHQTPPRRARLRPRQNSLRSPQRPTLHRTTATDRFTRSISRSEFRSAGEDSVAVLCRGV